MFLLFIRKYAMLSLFLVSVPGVSCRQSIHIRVFYCSVYIMMLQLNSILIRQYIRGFCRKSLPADSRHSNGYELCPSSREADFIQSLLSTGKKQLSSRFNLTYRYIDDVLSINNPEFENYLGQMYPAELEIKDTTESTISASYID